jgi:hypothetical protein
MLPTFLLARDHLEQAAVILQGTDSRSRQLRHIIERTIGLMDEFQRRQPKRSDNVLDFLEFQRRRRDYEE